MHEDPYYLLLDPRYLSYGEDARITLILNTVSI
jgi:hypothetical protein